MAEELVAVGCKAPAGVILNLDRYEVRDERNGMVATIPGKLPPVTLRGWSYDRLKNADPTTESGGYAITLAPKAFMDEWMKRNAASPLVLDKTIIMAAPGDILGKSAELAEVPKMFDQAPAKAQGVEKAEKD